MAFVQKVNRAMVPVVVLALVGCGPSTPCPEHPGGVGTGAAGSGGTGPASGGSAMDELPFGSIKGEGVVEVLHGYTVRDPYRWLEDAAKAEPWVTLENDRTARYFDVHVRPEVRERLEELYTIGSVSGAMVAGERVFYSRYDGRAEQPVLMVRDGKSGEEKVLIDLNTMHPDGLTALDWYHPSPTGRYIAYGLSKEGSEKSTLYVRDVDTLKDLSEEIPNTRAASVAWLKDESGFYYTRYPAPPDDDYDRWVYLHALGTDWAKDEYVFGKGREKTDWNTVAISEDGKTIVLQSFRGFAASDIYLMDRKSKKTVTVTEGEKALFWGELVDGVFYMQHNLDAPRFTIVAVNPKKPARKGWKTVIPEGEWPIEGFGLIAGKMAVHRIVKATSRVAIHDTRGKKLWDVELPGLGAASTPTGEWKGDRLVLGYSSFFTPSSLYTLPMGGKTDGGKLELLVEVESTFDGSAYEVVQVEYPSFDGTLVPMFLVHKKGLKKDGSNPTLLYGYGGFNITLRPAFSRRVLYWLESGGIYALANLRGGGELGEEWHEDGKRANKFKVFYDFEYAMRFLHGEGYTSPDKLGIMGGSNGGLLVGAMMTRCPELFEAAVGSVGLYDMVRFHKFLIAKLWVEEYGSPDVAEELGFLLSYSPYHNVVNGVEYPALYADTAESDSRVHWNHTAKFVARLHEASASAEPILFFMRRKVGHGRGKRRSDSIADEQQKLTFLLEELGVPRR